MIKVNKNIINNTSKGFTLIEHLFSVIILGFMLTIVMTTFVGVFRFYIWSTTTRNNQAYARQTLDVITREISSHKIYHNPAEGSQTNAICLVDPNDPNPTSSEKIVFTNNSVVTEQHDNGTCTSAISGSANVISNPNMNVLSDPDPSKSVSNFKLIDNSINSSYNPQGYHKSVVINMTLVNGVLNSATDSCRSGDAFCDKSVFITAATERQTSP